MRKKRTIIKNERGVALLWALITIAVLLAITGSMANLMIKESRMSTGIDGSISAYAAAESGIERGSYLVTQSPIVNPCMSACTVDSAPDSPTYQIIITPVADTFKIESTGKSGNTTRKIQKNVSTGSSARPYMKIYTVGSRPFGSDTMTQMHPISDLNNPLNSPSVPTIPISGSYTQEIELEILDPDSNFSIGFSGDVADQAIIFNKKYDSTNGNRISITNGSTESTPVTWAVPDDIGTPPLRKRYRIKIVHVKNQATQVRVERYLAGDCSEVISLASADSYLMTNVLFSGGSNVVSWNVTDGVTIGTVAKVGVMSVRPN
ncbi:hypothetical protein COY62_03085 [bacterium (Candidatus Howlettbacteria) CG_4_10_14_0_8_um_filter_40_9]|nr:MAG: hypothetical protein COY62_03085 [bacterium (Candidatus Howlettbacteria) CG_4_10_14_0_8_um_filter_40_9]